MDVPAHRTFRVRPFMEVEQFRFLVFHGAEDVEKGDVAWRLCQRGSGRQLIFIPDRVS